MEFQDFVNEAKVDFELNLYCMVAMGKEFVKTTIITWAPILAMVGIYNLLK